MSIKLCPETVNLIKYDDINYLNERINNEYCLKSSELISDKNMISKYEDSKSVINKKNKLKNICNEIITDERPDWYIYDKKLKKTIIGMNQLDIWNGGAQINRGSKYLINNKLNSKDTKLLCVICNKTKILNIETKKGKYFSNGFKNNTLCYLNNLKNIINDFFKISL